MSGLKKKILHVGCGQYNPDKLPQIFNRTEWQEIRLDIDPNVGPDIVCSITDMKTIQPESMDALYSSHNIEHLYPHDVQTALREFQRVLKPSGFAVITCPDIELVAEHIANGKLEETLYNSPAGPIAPIDILYGHRKSLESGHLFMAHKTGFSAQSLANAVVKAGFAKVEVKKDKVNFNLRATAYKS